MKATSRPDGFEVALTLAPEAGSVWFVFDGPKLVLRADGTLPTGEAPLDRKSTRLNSSHRT